MGTNNRAEHAPTNFAAADASSANAYGHRQYAASDRSATESTDANQLSLKGP